MNNRQLIDRFKKVHDLQFDLDLVFVFGVKSPHISAWVNEKRPIPALLKFRILQLIDFPHTAEFAPLFVDPTELAALVLRDRNAITELKALQR